jgi:hypothetical protein
VTPAATESLLGKICELNQFDFEIKNHKIVIILILVHVTLPAGVRYICNETPVMQPHTAIALPKHRSLEMPATPGGIVYYNQYSQQAEQCLAQRQAKSNQANRPDPVLSFAFCSMLMKHDLFSRICARIVL